MARILGDSTSARKCLFHRTVYPAHARAARNRRSAACVVPGVMSFHAPHKVRQGGAGSHKRRCNAARACSAGSRSDRWARDRQRKRHTGRTCPGASGAATKESRIQTIAAWCRSAWVPRQTPSDDIGMPALSSHPRHLSRPCTPMARSAGDAWRFLPVVAPREARRDGTEACGHRSSGRAPVPVPRSG